MSTDVYTMDYFIAKKPFNNDIYCGDTGTVKKFDDKLFIGIIDVLGHGKKAHKAALICDDFLERNYRHDLVETMKGLHEHIRGIRGAVGALCLLELKTGVLRFVGVGDTNVITFGRNNTRFVSRSGVIGDLMPPLREDKIKIFEGDLLVLYTDGVKTYFDLEEHPEMLKDGAKAIATFVIERFGRETDDALCIVVKYSQMIADGQTQMIADICADL